MTTDNKPNHPPGISPILAERAAAVAGLAPAGTPQVKPRPVGVGTVMPEKVSRDFLVVSALTLLSRITGFVRVAVFAWCFGGGEAADALTSALILTDILYRFLADGLISGPAVPIFVRRLKDPEALSRAYGTLLRAVVLIFLPIVVLLMLTASPVCAVLFPGFGPARQVMTSWLWLLLAPYLLFSVVSGLMTAFLNASGWFGLPAVGPTLVNVAAIVGIVVAGPGNSTVVAVAIVAGAIVQMLWHGWLVARTGIVGGVGNWRVVDPDVLQAFWRDFLPIGGWVFLTPIVPLLERYLLSSSAVGSVAALDYTDKLVSLPVGLIGISLASVVYPRLAKMSMHVSLDRLFDFLLDSLMLLSLVLTPIVLVMAAGVTPIVELVYRRGAFDAHTTELTVTILRSYVWAVLPMCLAMVLNRAFFARGRANVAFYVALLSLFVQVMMDLYLVPWYGAAVLGWSALAARWIQVVVLLVMLDLIGRRRSSVPWILAVLAFAVPAMSLGILTGSWAENFVARLGQEFGRVPGLVVALLLAYALWGPPAWITLRERFVRFFMR